MAYWEVDRLWLSGNETRCYDGTFMLSGSLLLLRNDRLHCRGKRYATEQGVSNSANQHHSFCKSAQPSVMFLSFILEALITVLFSLTHLENVEILSSLHQLIPQAREYSTKQCTSQSPLILLWYPSLVCIIMAHKEPDCRAVTHTEHMSPVAQKWACGYFRLSGRLFYLSHGYDNSLM